METFEDAERVRQGETVPPRFRKAAFHCLFCGVFTSQNWENLFLGRGGGSLIWECTCSNCHFASFWRSTKEGGRLLDPVSGPAPLPHPSMPDDVRAEYLEARSIMERSPRGASALLRLALQKLMPHLGQSGKNLNDDIAALVREGLDPEVQQALDALRVSGNNAVHPGELDLRDDPDTAFALFEVLNFVIEHQIERPKKLERLYGALPESAREAIEKRDSPST